MQVVSPPVFSSVRDVNEAIQDIMALLRVPRQSLGVICSPKGAVAGLLQIKRNPISQWEVISVCSASITVRKTQCLQWIVTPY